MHSWPVTSPVYCDDSPIHAFIGVSCPLSVRFKEHLNLDKATGMGRHCLATGHLESMSDINILCREQE